MKTIDTILKDLLDLQKDLESRIQQVKETESFATIERMALELMKVKNAIVALQPIVSD